MASKLKIDALQSPLQRNDPATVATLAELESMSVDRLYNTAVVHKKKNSLTVAENAFSLALDQDPNHVPSLLGLANLLQSKDPVRSKELFNKATGFICGPQSLPGESKSESRKLESQASIKNQTVRNGHKAVEDLSG